ncbi:OmpA family protein [Desulfovibrio sp. OttesenSCG-928-I05]|nr:OmpA family protein [Desulfovibrio sp. OttesenSCG-928-I05]
MAREKKEEEPAGTPAWMVTFSDLMTLLLTFFVLLLSMAVIDERRKLITLNSVSSAFGLGPTQSNPRSPENIRRDVEPGAMMEDDMEMIKDKIWDDQNQDLNFQENRYVQILSIDSEVLFAPGETQLKEEGKALLRKFSPVLVNIKYPLLVAGHSATRRDEEGGRYEVSFDTSRIDSTWSLSLARSVAVYRLLAEEGVPTSHLSIEAFGQFRPRYSDATAEGRRKNRRVDLVLDKRNTPFTPGLQRFAEPPIPRDTFMFRDFRFDLNNRPQPRRIAPGGDNTGRFGS